MGLDIYVYKTRNLESNDIIEVNKLDDIAFRNRFNKGFNWHIKKLSALSGDDYNNAYHSFMAYVKKNIIYDFIYHQLDKKINTANEVREWYDKNASLISLKYQYYYRKAYFVFDYCNQHCNMKDEYLCWIDEDDAKGIIEKADELLEDEDDEYEREKIKKVKKDFKRLLKHWKSGEKVYIIFSY